MVLLVATGNRGSMWKDRETLRAAAGLIAARTSRPRLLFIALGDDAAALRIAGIDVLPIGHQTDPRTVARYYQAADVYLHSARADTFPSSILEALACGTPVVATAVGGIPEQVRPAALEAVRARRARTAGTRDRAAGSGRGCRHDGRGRRGAGRGQRARDACSGTTRRATRANASTWIDRSSAISRGIVLSLTTGTVMQCPTVAELPPASSGKTGWPWTEGTRAALAAGTLLDGRPWPRISIVTPSLNHGAFIEEAIRSVLLQAYPNLELIVVDGRSTDGSIKAIGRYGAWLSHWICESDTWAGERLEQRVPTCDRRDPRIPERGRFPSAGLPRRRSPASS